MNKAFLERIGLPETASLDLGQILTAFYSTIPFENLGIIRGERTGLDEASLTEKIVNQRRGGVCYELNALLYYFLLENGLDVRLIQGTVYNHAKGSWSLSGTHAALLMTNEKGVFLVDAGFGTNVAGVPIPMNGEAVQTASGQFRVLRQETEEGTHLLQMKLAYEEAGEWKTGYAFCADQPIYTEELTAMQHKIHTHPDSPFNKAPLAAMRTADGGYKSLSPQSFTVTNSEGKVKQEIGEKEFAEVAEREFGLI
ncbi:arylamine N-acetyltransferase [Bacillus mangrovi]|uniref:Arylamine N-acetyltransferase n=1 Tax=Metabacillus mangrovi TaxID=1491830 RepID=A0A7X2S607_9BACI|nr:arylamine N-acetyltransferase [Metabacillus mangrovi]MTH54067.1 arylamine N-acetyltransferase [Metabacillus mangrovi]